MTRSFDEYHQILELWEGGLKSKKAIARLTGIPRATVRDCIKRYGSISQLENKANEIDKTLVLDDLVHSSGSEDFLKSYSYILGVYLGDGYIDRVRNVYRLRLSLDAKYLNIIEGCVAALNILLPNNKVGRVPVKFRKKLSSFQIVSYFKHWTLLLPQHGNGAKHTRFITLENWQEQIVNVYPLEFFRGLYHSDGSRFRNVVNGKDYPRYQFTNYSTDIIGIFCKTCDLLGLRWTATVRHSGTTAGIQDIYISRRKDVEYLDSVIGPKS